MAAEVLGGAREVCSLENRPGQLLICMCLWPPAAKSFLGHDFAPSLSGQIDARWYACLLLVKTEKVFVCTAGLHAVYEQLQDQQCTVVFQASIGPSWTCLRMEYCTSDLPALT